MVRRAICLAILAAFPCAAAGCIRGLIYSHTVQPLTTNLDHTPVGTGGGSSGDVKNIRYYVDVFWDSNALGDIARENGLETLHYADLEILSVFGIWRQYTVHLYGDAARSP